MHPISTKVIFARAHAACGRGNGVSMRKSFTKIICVTVAAISALSAGVLSACGNNFGGVTVKDDSLSAVSSNGGFLVESGKYVYFVNGKASYTDDNTYGSVVKGSVQRISKEDLNNRNYANTETVVPSVIYSEYYDSGIYIYGDYIYYSTPSTAKNSNGVVQNEQLEFRRAKADGTSAEGDYFFRAPSTGKDMAYRYVKQGDTVYLVYVLGESLYESSTTNIHSVNTTTGEDTLLAYNIGEYAFDDKDAENPYIYYTMSVTSNIGGTDSISENYNQLYRVRADVTEAPREYDFSYVDDFDADKDPLYINLGDFVYDGIGLIENGNSVGSRVTQFNYNWDFTHGKKTDTDYAMTAGGYRYAIKTYENGKLYYTRTDVINDNDSAKSTFVVTDAALDGDADGKVDSSWDAISANATAETVLKVANSTDYIFLDEYGMSGKVLYKNDGLKIGELTDGKVTGEYNLITDSVVDIVAVRKETTKVDDADSTEEHVYAYYSLTGGNGSHIYRIAIDGAATDYEANKMQVTDVWKYKGVQILDIDATTSWYPLEFVGNQIIYATEATVQTSYHYVFACDLTSADGDMMSNKELKEYKDKYQAVADKISDYDEKENSDGTKAYENLTAALKYQFRTRDPEYVDELIQAYVDISGKKEDYIFSTDSAKIYREFAACEGDWTEYKDDFRTVNGEKVYANSEAYYYSVMGKVKEEDATSIKDAYKSEYSMPEYPEDTRTWWERLTLVGQILFIVGMCVLGLAVIGGAAVLTVWLVKKHKSKGEDEEPKRKKDIDITDDKDIDVYADEEKEE